MPVMGNFRTIGADSLWTLQQKDGKVRTEYRRA